MKKNILMIGLLAVFVMGSFCFAFASLLPQRDNIQFTQTVLYGNPKAAEGLELHYQSHYDNHLFWDTTWTIGTPADTAETDYRFSAKEDRNVRSLEQSIRLETMSYLTYYVQEVPSGLQKAFDELQAETGPGERNSRTIRLTDYYQYYPISGTIELDGMGQIHWDDSYHSLQVKENLTPEADSTYRITKAFQDFFRIPVLSGDTMEITVSLSSNGSSTSTRSSYGSDTSYSMETESVVTADACYFTFGTRSSSGQYIDTSLIPGGFGIYCLPYSADGIEPENLSMVYPLDPKTQVISMNLSSDQSALFLITEEPGGYMFTEIQLATMETLQRFQINDAGGSIYDDMLHVTDDYFTFYGSDANDAGGYRIFARNADGKFEFDFLIPSPSGEEREYFNFYSDATFAYDGQRAALTGTAVSTTHWSSAFTVAVYDETGMLYCGEYNTRQNCRQSSQGNYNCVPAANELADIRWS